jgi:lipopolysaccharide export system protein LptA
LRVTIERLRTLVLVTGGVLVAALVAFLVVGRWRSRPNLREIPKKLGIDIKQEQNDIVFTHARGDHTYYKVRASKAVQLAQGNRLLLQHVQIELYSVDGKSVDRISGNEFEYDQKAGTAKAAGPVEILIERPGVAPAVAPNATAEKAASKTPLAGAANDAAAGQIDVKTSGLTFDQKTGIATTDQRVQFSTLQGDGSSTGATFDSDNGQLVLDRDVELNVERNAAKVLLRAQHAEFARTDLVCRMRGAIAHYGEGEASAGAAVIHFRVDGTAEHLDASEGFALTTANGAHVNAPLGTMDFDEQNRPQRGHLEGGVTMDSSGEGRKTHGTAPAADLVFADRGELRHMHLERGVEMHTEQTTITEGNQPELRSRRDWQSPVADVDFRSAGKGKAELASIRGTGGVVIVSETQRGDGPVLPSRMVADVATGQFGDGQRLTQMTGEGHASLAQTTASGTRQTTSGERVEVHFAVSSVAGLAQRKNPAKKGARPVAARGKEASEIESATVDGNVVLTQTPAPKPGETPSPLQATAERAEYEGTDEWLHLTGDPRIDDAGLQLAADRVDVSRSSGDAFAKGNVKATWIDQDVGKKGQVAVGLGGQGPAHVIASEAQLQKTTGEATFRGNARLWQEANSVTAPVIVLNRTRQTLVAHGVAGDPVRIVMLSANRVASPPGEKMVSTGDAGKDRSPSVVQINAADLKYSEAERMAVLHGGDTGRVEADTGGATTTSNEAELVMLPPGNHAGPNGTSSQVDRLTARGHVMVNSLGRHGVGEQLAYSSETGEYALTGTAAHPPRLTDPAHGTVSGDLLIFNTRDDSVSIEGQGRKTITETTAPK